MKVIFTGAGSIGQRHINNLSLICKDKEIELHIDVLRKSYRELDPKIKGLISREIYDLNKIDTYYDVAFITDETYLHYNSIMMLKNHCKNMFIEKPIFDKVNYNLNDICPGEEQIFYVAAPIRFTKYYEQIKEIINHSDVYAARIIFSSYMPSWQKGRDYRKSFRCFSDLGGGVDIDSLHEIDYMTSLFGIPENVCRVAGKYSNLEMDANDVASYLFTYKDKIIEMHLDYFGRIPNRNIEIFSKDDVIVIDFNDHTLVRKLKKEIINYGSDDSFYEDEMTYFLDLIQSGGRKKNINTIDNAMQSLRLAKGII